MDEETRTFTLSGLKEGFLNERYIQVQDNKLKIDKNIMNLDILNFKIRNKIYQNRFALKVEMENNGINVVSTRWDYVTDKLAADAEAKIPFKDLCIEYDVLAKSNNFGNNLDRMKLIEQEKPFVVEAYDALGIDKIKELKFNQTNIRREVVKRLNVSQKEKVKKLLLEQIGMFKPIELRKAKDIIAEIYLFLGVRNTATATGLNEYFLCHETVKRIDKKSVRHIEIINEKIVG